MSKGSVVYFTRVKMLDGVQLLVQFALQFGTVLQFGTILFYNLRLHVNLGVNKEVESDDL